MPFAFVLPTTSAFSFSSAFACPSHPSLLRTASVYRGVVRDTLKKHKRLPPESQAANLTLVVSSLRDYLPYLLSLSSLAQPLPSSVSSTSSTSSSSSSSPALPLWRWAALTTSRIPGREPPRTRIPVRTLADELVLVLATLGHALSLQARASLQPLYVTSVVPVGPQQRLSAITSATRNLLEAASIYTYGAAKEEAGLPSPLAPAASFPPLRAHAALALAEATLLAVLKDDPYPAVVAQDRNQHDREWMYKAPDLPKVRAHLFARLCLAAASHAATASASSSASSSSSSSDFLRYLEDLRRTCRAKACRFFALDAELGGQTGTALAWLHAALQDVEQDSSLTSASTSSARPHLLARFRRERSEKREDRRVERGLAWGSDAGRLEEARVLAMLDAKWTKQNDTVNPQPIPPAGPLLAQMPSGRDIHTVPSFDPPALDAAVLDALRAPPDGDDNDDRHAAADNGHDDSSDDDNYEGSGSASACPRDTYSSTPSTERQYF